ncbi:hypothetical protein F511_21863 [Dorcoceras hygrometricum]|uniref:Uncharacterized protein n=1 Tax=Dorcoceras hygrometricum TaxID=472368 RepID=A0A2Z7CZE4_9LAMI|nr:hypothetical protein F511_21863 [Dorcoceras hygrometricum]
MLNQHKLLLKSRNTTQQQLGATNPPALIYLPKRKAITKLKASPENSRHFRPPIFTFEVALDSSRKALSFLTALGGCHWLEQKHEAAIFGSVFIRAGFNQISRDIFVVIVAQNQGCEGERRYRTLISLLRSVSHNAIIIFVKLMAQKLYFGPIALDRMTTDISFHVVKSSPNMKGQLTLSSVAHPSHVNRLLSKP